MNVFISSTFKDLQRARLDAHNVLVSKGHVVDLSEALVGLTDEKILERLRSRVVRADALFLIVGFASGSAPKVPNLEERTFTQVEVNAALSAGIPIHTFLLHPNPEIRVDTAECVTTWFNNSRMSDESVVFFYPCASKIVYLNALTTVAAGRK